MLILGDRILNKLLCLNAKVSGKFRTEFLEEKAYRVAPVVILVEGVMNGKLYPREEIAKYPEAWNGRPVLVDHRYTEDGIPISCNTPSLYDKDVIGRLFNTFYDEGKLKSEVWICEDKVLQICPDLLSKLNEDSQLEVSTGVWTDDVSKPGTWKVGESSVLYNAVTTNYRPDHLALLPDSVGACSWEDGCGVRVNCQKEEESVIINLLDKARRPKFSGSESSSWEDVPRSFKDLVSAYYKSKGEDTPEEDSFPTSVQDLSQSMKDWISSLSLLGSPEATSFKELYFFPVVNPVTGKLSEGALKAVLGGRGSSSDIDEGVLKSAQDKARKLLKDEFNMEANSEEDIPEEGSPGFLTKFALAVQKFLGVNKNTPQSFQSITTKLDDWVQGYIRALYPPVSPAVEAPPVPYSWGYVRDVFTDRFVFFVDGKDGRKYYQVSYSSDPSTGKVSIGTDMKEVFEKVEYIEVNESLTTNLEEQDTMRKEKIGKLIANGKFAEADRTWLKGLEDSVFDKIWSMGKVQKADPPPASNSKAPEANAAPPAAPEAPPSANEMDPEEKEALEHGKRLFRQLKNNLIDGIMANKRNKFTKETLASKPIEELEALSDLAGVDVDFSANAPASKGKAPIDLNSRREDGSGIPVPPKMNWKRLDNGNFVPDYTN